jgi:hypothetical protein
MPYSLPNFNLKMNVWHTGLNPAVDPPTATLQGQLYIANKQIPDVEPGVPQHWVPSIFLRIGAGTYVPVNLDIWEVPHASGAFYLHRWWDRIHKGFPNEYWAILVEQRDWPLFAPLVP